jgi:hypothetical protein
VEAREPIKDVTAVVVFHRHEDALLASVWYGEVAAELEARYDDPEPVELAPGVTATGMAQLRDMALTADSARWVSFLLDGPDDPRLAAIADGRTEDVLAAMNQAASEAADG